MFCPTCGFDCKDENFCPKCGRNLKSGSNPDSGIGSPHAPTPPIPKPRESGESLVRKAFAAQANSQLFLTASILFTIGALIEALIQFEGNSYAELFSIASYALPDLKGLSTYGIVAALALLVIAFALLGLRFQSTAKKTIEPTWLYIIFGALIVHIFFNAVACIKVFSALSKLKKWMGDSDEALVIMGIAYGLLIGCILGAIIEGIAARIVFTAAQSKSITCAPGMPFLKTILQILGWIGAIGGVVGLLFVKGVFLPCVAVIASSIAKIRFGRILNDYTL